MPRGFSNYSVPLQHAPGYLTMFTWMSARLYELAWMTQGCIQVSFGGPEWLFHCDGKEATTRPALTLEFADGRVAYWSTLERRRTTGLPDWVEVQRFHAARSDADFWLLTDQFLNDHTVEYRNRTNGYYLLAHARAWRSEDVERDVLMAIHPHQRQLGELAEQLKHPVAHVYAAVLRLWRRKLVDLPMATKPMSDAWLVKGASHDIS